MEPTEAGAVPDPIPLTFTKVEVRRHPVRNWLSRLWRSVKTGARLGFRVMSWIAAPFVYLTLVLSLSLTAVGLGAGRGLAFNRWTLRAVGFYLLFALWGLAFGGTTGLVAGLLPDPPPGSRRAVVWERLSHPRRLFRKRTADAPAPSPRRRRWPWFVGVPALLALLAAAGLGMYLDRMVVRKVADAMAEADRDDPDWMLDDLMASREPVPDEENGAIVVAEVNAMLPERWPLEPEEEPDSPSNEAHAAYNRLDAIPDNVRLDSGTANAIRASLNDYADALDLARTVVDYRRGRHEVEIGPRIFDTPLPETDGARNVTRFLNADAAVQAHLGDLDGALESCRAILGVARSIGDEPFLTSQYVHFAIGTVSMNMTRRVLGQGEPSDEALARLQSLLLDELSRPLLLAGLRGERASLAELFVRVVSGELPISALSENKESLTFLQPGQGFVPLASLAIDYQLGVTIEWMNEVVAIARRPYTEQHALWKAWEQKMTRARDGRIESFAKLLPLLIMPAIAAGGSAQSRYQGDLGSTAIAIAAERHRRKTGSWPASIGAIDPTILPKPPVDPFTGRPFIMEHRDGKLFVHSVGPNLKDEHGAYEPKFWMLGGRDDVGATLWDVDRRALTPTP